MEDSILRIISSIIGSLILSIIFWYVWSIKQTFVTKKELKEYKDKHKQDHKELEFRLAKQSEDIIEIKTYIKSISQSISDIKTYLLSKSKK